jgi:formylglycine-generating enzyme required for sulfatase activity
MTVLPTGRFKQGAARDDRDALPAEKPQHIVLIRHPLAISTSELTVGEFREFADATKRALAGCEVYDGEWHHNAESSWLYPGFTQNADHPVTCVSWNDAVAYAEWLSVKTGHHYRLPSSSEWEYAARAGVDAALPWSPAMQAACEYANVADRSAARRYPKWSVFACKDGYVNTSAVASFKANAFGIYDMLGNVLEWTEDCWHDDYSKTPVDGSARMDGDCVEHELRGGSWFSSPAFVRLSYRNHSASSYRSSSVGVRLVREVGP